MPVTDEAIARRLYQAYNDQGPNPWKSWDGRAVPSWDELNDQVRGKWGAAAKASRTAFHPAEPVRLALFAEGDLESVEAFTDPDTRRAFAQGFHRGAGCYGAGEAQAIAVPEEVAELDAGQREQLDAKLALVTR